MNLATESPPPRDPPAGDIAAVPGSGHLWWMYLLVVVGLASTGAGAAQAVFDTHNLGDIAGAVACLDQRHLTGLDVSTSLSAPERAGFAACVDPFNHRHGIAALAGAGLLPVASWLLMLAGGLAVRFRFRLGRTGAPADAAAARFAGLCAAARLTGRREPRLVLTAAAPQAFTTGLPLARPWVVLPIRYAYAEPAEFDVTVLHELAHVRSGDLLWASWVWWTGWLNLPVLVLAAASTLSRPWSLPSRYTTSLWLSAALSVVVLLLRAALLRRRELLADRYAVGALGDDGPLLAALGRPPGAERSGPVARLTGNLRALTAVHPAYADRAGADPASWRRWEGGFVLTAVTGVVAMFAFQSVYVALLDLLGVTGSDPRLPAAVAFAAASLLWACVVVPTWTRRAAAAHAASPASGWAGPVAGTAVGVPLGYCLQVPGASTAVGLTQFDGHVLLTCAPLALCVIGVAALTAGLAARTAARGPGPVHLLVAVLTGALTLTVVLSVTVDVATAHRRWASGAHARTLLMGLGDAPAWRFAPLFLLAGLAFAAWPRRVRPWRAWGRRWAGAVLPVAVVGGLGATLSWQARMPLPRSPDALYLMVYQRYWICALAGWTTFAAVLVTVRERDGDRAPVVSRLPAALTAALATAASAGLLQFAATAALGHGRNLRTFQDSLRLPMWLLLAGVIATLPAVLVVAGARGHRRRPRPAVVTSGACLVAAALSVVVVSGALAALTVGPHDYSESGATVAAPVPRSPAGPGRARSVPAVASPSAARLAGRLVAQGAGGKRLLQGGVDGEGPVQPGDLHDPGH